MGRRTRYAVAAPVALVLVAAAFASSAQRAAAKPETVTAVVRHTAPGTVRTGTLPQLDAATRGVLTRRLTGGGRTFICSPAASTANSPSSQSCTISASKGLCIEISTNPSVAQTCDFTQTATTGTNVAIAVQVILQRDGGQTGSKSQSGSQTVSTMQSNASGSNVNWSVQIVKQLLGRGWDNPDNEFALQQRREARQEASGSPADFTSLIQSLEPTEVAQESYEPRTLPMATSWPVTQVQNSQQTIQVCQGPAPDPCSTATGMTGKNVNGNYQSLRQWEWANSAPSIDQEQNSQPGSCTDSSSFTLNMCSVVHQTTTGGKNLNGLFELYRQFQRALYSPSATQFQDTNGLNFGSDLGGLGHDVFQKSFGDLSGAKRELILTGQRARQVQKANDIGTLDQEQDPHVDKGYHSSQTGSENDAWHGWINSDQTQLANGSFTSWPLQAQILTYNGFSTGDIVAKVRGTQNGNTQTDQCPPGQFGEGGDSCEAIVFQGVGD